MDRLIRAVLQLVQHPGSNLAAAAIGLSVVVLAVIILLLVLLIWALAEQEETSEDEPDETAAERHLRLRAERAEVSPIARGLRVLGRSKRVTVWLSLGIVLAALAVAYESTSSEQYCGSTCHAMTASADSWKASSHARVPCVRCHEGKHVLTLAAAAASRMHDVFAQLTGGRDLAASVPSRRCLDCHAGITRGVTTSANGIRMRHSDVIVGGGSCDSCHGSVGHARKDVPAPAKMPQCLRCHDGREAPSACSTCHVGDVGKLPVYERHFTRVDLPEPTCGGCHSQQKCDGCHGLRMPHPADFKSPAKHAYLGSFEHRKLCYRCHVFADCSCHRLVFDQAHGPTWEKDHQRYSVSDGARYCTGCHTRTKNLCLDCHPGLRS